MERLIDLGRKSARYWWLIGIFTVAGGGLAFGFAMTHVKKYDSWSTLFYEEQISSSILSNREDSVQRNIGDRYRELLLARGQLDQILNDPALNPFPEITDPDISVDKLRQAIRFDARGANAFRITFSDSDPDRCKAVTEKLTKLLQDKDEAIRNEQALATVTFATQQKNEAATELGKREHALAEFLAKHPEFAQENGQQNEGASIRAIHGKDKTPVAAAGSSRLYALERQRQRIQARLDAPPGAPIVVHQPASPEKIAAEGVVADAQRDLSNANHELEDALSKYTDKHPTVIKAQEHVANAKAKLRAAQAAVPPDVEATIAPATAEDRVKLQKELQQLDQQINSEQQSAATAKGTAAPVVDNTSTNWVVQLETQHADLRRAMNEQRERVQSLADSVFRSQIDANQKLAEQGGRLAVIDPAFKPIKPSGPGKSIFLMAGVALFFSLGSGLAVGLALIDDRLYRRSDIDALGIPVLAVIPTAIMKKQKKR